MPQAPLAGGRILRHSGTAIGTRWQVAMAVPAATQAAFWRGRVAEVVTQQVGQVCDRFSHWQPDSWVSQFGRLGEGQALPLDAALGDVLSMCGWVHEASGGAYHPGLGPLMALWGYGPCARPPAWPAPGEVGACMPAPLRRDDWQALSKPGARLPRRGGLTLDLSGIAKGYLVDVLWMALVQEWGPHVMVEVGGEARGGGVRPDGQPWWVDLERVDGTPARVALHGVAVASSGRSQTRAALRSPSGQPFERHHTLDPRTGWPVRHGTQLVTVLHASAMAADAWATALHVLPPGQAMQLAKAQGLAARIVGRGPMSGLDGLDELEAGLRDGKADGTEDGHRAQGRQGSQDHAAWTLHSPAWQQGLD